MTHEHDHDEEDELKRRKERKTARKIASRTDRSKFKKTDLKKREQLLSQQHEQKISDQNLLVGRVLAILPEELEVESGGHVYSCVLSGLLKKEIKRLKNLVTVGDFVRFDPEKELVVAVEPRKTVLSRQEHLRRHQEQLIAANIDLVIITASVVAPHLKPSLIDRYLIATRKGNMAPLVVINKIDLLEEDPQEKERLQEFLTTYKKLGVPVVCVSILTGEGLEELKEKMKDKASVFSGQSGVGKSSLINAITGLDLATSDLAKKTQKGSHTTTRTHLIPLSFGGWCIDTPGIRSFGIWELKKEDLNTFFPEIYDLSVDCKYPSCTHEHEPSCAVKEAVEKGYVSALRLDSFHKLLSEVID